jgi:benzil reductase ((S)-benzoin forming)
MGRVYVWISGASSGIGAALAATIPFASARVVGVARRPPAVGEHLCADLADPGQWRAVRESFSEGLSAPDIERALFLHFAGTGRPIGPASSAPVEEYASAVLLNSASGQALGQAFLAAAAQAGVVAMLVLCSSPAAAVPMFGMSPYSPGKRALEQWAACVALEGASVLTVVPYAVDTPMLRDAIDSPPELLPLGEVMRDASAHGALASAESVAGEIWALVDAGVPSGSIHPVGAVPPDARAT